MFFCRVCVSPFLSFTMSCVSWKTARGCCCSSDDKVVTAGFPTLKASAGSCVLPQSYLMRDRVNVQTRFPRVNALPRKPNLQPRQTSCKVAKDAGVELSSTSSDLHVLFASFGFSLNSCLLNGPYVNMLTVHMEWLLDQSFCLRPLPELVEQPQ